MWRRTVASVTDRLTPSHAHRYSPDVIKGFGDKPLKRYAEKGDAKHLPVRNLRRLDRVLAALNHATVPADMDVPGWDFHELGGDRKGTYAVKITGNWRLTFRWDAGAIDVQLEDYH